MGSARSTCWCPWAWGRAGWRWPSSGTRQAGSSRSLPLPGSYDCRVCSADHRRGPAREQALHAGTDRSAGVHLLCIGACSAGASLLQSSASPAAALPWPACARACAGHAACPAAAAHCWGWRVPSCWCLRAHRAAAAPPCAHPVQVKVLYTADPSVLMAPRRPRARMPGPMAGEWPQQQPQTLDGCWLQCRARACGSAVRKRPAVGQWRATDARQLHGLTPMLPAPGQSGLRTLTPLLAAAVAEMREQAGDRNLFDVSGEGRRPYVSDGKGMYDDLAYYENRCGAGAPAGPPPCIRPARPPACSRPAPDARAPQPAPLGSALQPPAVHPSPLPIHAPSLPASACAKTRPPVARTRLRLQVPLSARRADAQA
jgi:hypothetical protein